MAGVAVPTTPDRELPIADVLKPPDNVSAFSHLMTTFGRTSWGGR